MAVVLIFDLRIALIYRFYYSLLVDPILRRYRPQPRTLTND